MIMNASNQALKMVFGATLSLAVNVLMAYGCLAAVLVH
jgi:hypothetical protein